MTPEMVIDVGRETLYVTLMVAAPMLLFGLVIGALIGVFQAVTQINEMTLVFVPKILAVSIAVIIFMPWMIKILIAFATKMVTKIGTL